MSFSIATNIPAIRAARVLDQHLAEGAGTPPAAARVASSPTPPAPASGAGDGTTSFYPGEPGRFVDYLA